ncbi:DUF3606 domain-containing protein [Cupriavidus pauculus]|uniref:DUF3606 domain-containing protein n=1 Tax=Cupriavidus pauculus TaxID=82633 RepID=UPI001FD09D6A|nr:DUF3606 domain-containing protein [Cupriavidus pauculus]
MADNKAKRGPADRRQVAGGETYEVAYAARKFEKSKEEILKAIEKVGNDREKLKKYFGKK